MTNNSTWIPEWARPHLIEEPEQTPHMPSLTEIKQCLLVLPTGGTMAGVDIIALLSADALLSDIHAFESWCADNGIAITTEGAMWTFTRV